MSKDPVPLWLDFMISGTGVGIATACTNPIDVVKTRMQLIDKGVAEKPRGMISTAVGMAKSEGLSGFTQGMNMAVTRAYFYGGARLGLQPVIKGLFPSDPCASPSSPLVCVAKNAAAGTVSGAIAAAAANPLDLAKVRLQQSGHGYSGTLHVFRDVMEKEGVRGLFRGTVPSAVRAGLLTASQVAAYGESKRIAVQLTGWQEADFSVHLSASMIAGLVTTTTTTPADVVKTRVFVGGKSGLRPWECVRDLVRREGLRGLQKGWGPNYVRLGPQTAIIFVAVEWLRKLAGLEAL